MSKATRRNKWLAKQPINRRLMAALTPCVAGSVYFFGWRSLAVLASTTLVACIVEYLFARSRKEPLTEAVFVTSTIFALIMPPSVPWHVAAIGAGFAVMFGKEVFGGFGRNIFNPAMAGRCFVYVCFPVALTGTWSPPAQGPWGALNRWTTAPTAEATTGATPMAHLKAGRLVLSNDPQASNTIPFQLNEAERVVLRKSTLLRALAWGRLSGTMGATSAFLILIGGAYVFVTKTACRATIITLVTTYAVLNQLLYWFGVEPAPGAWPAVLGGGFLFGAFFMATDPVSSPRTRTARVLYAIIIGVCTTVIRNFSIFNGGLMFSILIGNMFAPILDYAVRTRQATSKEGAAP